MGSDRVDQRQERLHGHDVFAPGSARRTRSGCACRTGAVQVERIKALERNQRERRHVNEILHKASAYFAQAEFACRSEP